MHLWLWGIKDMRLELEILGREAMSPSKQEEIKFIVQFRRMNLCQWEGRKRG